MKKLILSSLLIIVFLMQYEAISQKEANNFYFGDYCGITFNPDNIPKAVTDGAMITDEGCATISDWQGNLLFYTDGTRVWHRKHGLMPHGNGLHGDTSSTQSAVIIPKPHSPYIYYIFTVDEQGKPNGLSYSEVDMRLNNGDGDINDIKNVKLTTPVCEKITAVKHKNGVDIWIIAHEWNSNRFFAYLLTESGVINNPVISATGTVHTGSTMNAAGYMKTSPNGKSIAVAIYETGIFELCDFDNATGLIKNPIPFNIPDNLHCYGLEFSPDGSKLYVSRVGDYSGIYQVDVSAGDSTAIANSIVTIVENPFAWLYHAMQYAPDNKIYIAKRKQTFLSSIEFPNKKGDMCGFKENAVDLNGRICRAGLPTFNQSFIDIFLEIQGTTSLCEGDTISLHARSYDSCTYHWTGPNGFSSDELNITIPNAKVVNTGYYKATLKYKNLTKTDSIYVNVISTVANILEGTKIHICDGEVITVHCGNDPNLYKIQWSDGSTETTLSIKKSGNYFLRVENSLGCIDTTFFVVTSGTIIKAWLPDTSSEIGTTNFCIPLKILKENQCNITETLSFNAEIRYEASALLPMNVTGNIVNGERIINLTGDKITLTNDEMVIGNLCGTVLLAKNDKTLLRLTKFEFVGMDYSYEINDGSLTISGLCQRGISRLQTLSPAFMNIDPNPVNQSTIIRYNLPAASNIKLSLFNQLGEEVSVLMNDYESSGEHNYQLSIVNYQLNTGLYFLRLQTENEILTDKIFVAK